MIAIYIKKKKQQKPNQSLFNRTEKQQQKQKYLWTVNGKRQMNHDEERD